MCMKCKPVRDTHTSFVGSELWGVVLTWFTVRIVCPGAVVAGGGHAGDGWLVGLVAHHSDDAPVRHHRARLRLVGEAAVLNGGHHARRWDGVGKTKGHSPPHFITHRG